MEVSRTMEIERVGVIARFKPLHNGAARLLEYTCKQAQEVIIGIGSANKYNLRNPFRVEESEAMVHSYLASRFDNYKIVHVPDFAHMPEFKNGQRWKQFVTVNFGILDGFITSNAYVAELLANTYRILHPNNIIPERLRIKLRATQVRAAMAKNECWEQLVPTEVAQHILEKDLVTRFQQEFGSQAIISATAEPESCIEEYLHTTEK